MSSLQVDNNFGSYQRKYDRTLQTAGIQSLNFEKPQADLDSAAIALAHLGKKPLTSQEYGAIPQANGFKLEEHSSHSSSLPSSLNHVSSSQGQSQGFTSDQVRAPAKTAAYTFVTSLNRDSLPPPHYWLTIRQQAQSARICSFKEKGATVDRRPVDPPPIIQIHSNEMFQEELLVSSTLFVRATLVSVDTEAEVTLKDRQLATAGITIQSPQKLKDDKDQLGAFCIWTSLSIRIEGTFKIRYTLYESRDNIVMQCATICSEPVLVMSPKNFRGMTESSPLAKCFADQGVKIRIRKETSRVAPLKKRMKKSSGNAADSVQFGDSKSDAYNISYGRAEIATTIVPRPFQSAHGLEDTQRKLPQENSIFDQSSIQATPSRMVAMPNQHPPQYRFAQEYNHAWPQGPQHGPVPGNQAAQSSSAAHNSQGHQIDRTISSQIYAASFNAPGPANATTYFTDYPRRQQQALSAFVPPHAYMPEAPQFTPYPGQWSNANSNKASMPVMMNYSSNYPSNFIVNAVPAAGGAYMTKPYDSSTMTNPAYGFPLSFPSNTEYTQPESNHGQSSGMQANQVESKTQAIVFKGPPPQYSKSRKTEPL